MTEQKKSTSRASWRMGGVSEPKFTEQDLLCWPHWTTRDSYLLEILNGDYPLEKLREDLRSLIGSEYDPRTRLEKPTP